MKKSDIRFINHGSVALMFPLTRLGKDWVKSNIPADAMTFGAAIVVEPRYIYEIADGAHADGLNVRITT